MIDDGFIEVPRLRGLFSGLDDLRYPYFSVLFIKWGQKIGQKRVRKRVKNRITGIRISAKNLRHSSALTLKLHTNLSSNVTE